LIATDFERLATGFAPHIQKQSTTLSTGFCGYRKIHYSTSRFGYSRTRNRGAIAALQ